MKKPESKIHIEVTLESAPAGSALPPNLVCSAVCLEALQQYCTTLADFAEASKTKPFERVAGSDVVLATFPLIMNDTALMTHFANAWSSKSKKLGKKATKQQLNDAFRYFLSFPRLKLHPPLYVCTVCSTSGAQRLE